MQIEDWAMVARGRLRLWVPDLPIGIESDVLTLNHPWLVCIVQDESVRTAATDDLAKMTNEPKRRPSRVFRFFNFQWPIFNLQCLSTFPTAPFHLHLRAHLCDKPMQEPHAPESTRIHHFGIPLFV